LNPNITLYTDIFHRFFEPEHEPKICRLFELTKEMLYDSRLEDMFTYEGFKRMLGVICLNAQGGEAFYLGLVLFRH
jgi:hypothetical protein